VCAQSKIVFAAVNSPSDAPPDAANVDTKTVGRDATDGHPQSAPKFVWPKLLEIAATAMAIVAAIFDKVLFVFILFFLVKYFLQSHLLNGTNVFYEVFYKMISDL
jgi:hypothetical protein